MIVAEAQLVGRAQHAARGNPADDGFFQQGAGARDDGAGGCEYPLHPGVRIRRAADHLDLPIPGIHDAHFQPVGVGMAFGRNHRRDREGFEAGGAVLDPLHLMAEHDQAIDDRVERCLGIEMLLQPGERGLHPAPPGSGPRTREGMSSGKKP